MKFYRISYVFRGKTRYTTVRAPSQATADAMARTYGPKAEARLLKNVRKEDYLP